MTRDQLLIATTPCGWEILWCLCRGGARSKLGAQVDKIDSIHLGGIIPSGVVHRDGRFPGSFVLCFACALASSCCFSFWSDGLVCF